MPELRVNRRYTLGKDISNKALYTSIYRYNLENLSTVCLLAWRVTTEEQIGLGNEACLDERMAVSTIIKASENRNKSIQ
jgi:hypothetical protein